jgi:hypothetical protein
MAASQQAQKKPADFKKTRAYIRFTADPNTVAWISTSTDPMTFQAQQVALVINESYTGCSFVTVAKPIVGDGQRFTVQPGRAAPVAAVVRWMKEVSPGVWQIGCELEAVDVYRK